MQLTEELSKILKLVGAGLSNEEISIQLNYSRSTVKRRIKELFALYKVDNRFKLGQEYLKEQYL